MSASVDTAPQAMIDGVAAPARLSCRFRLGLVAGAYVILLGFFTSLVKVGADHWAWTTVIAYGPRWPWLLLGVLVTAGKFRRAWIFWPTLLFYLLCSAWLMDVRIPNCFASAKAGLRILTLNADGPGSGGRQADPAQVARLIAELRPDVIFLQEWLRPQPPSLPPGKWATSRHNAQWTITRLPILATVRCPPDLLLGKSGLMGCQVALDDGTKIWLYNIHLETPRAGFEQLLSGDMDGFATIRATNERRMTISQQAIQFIRSKSDMRDTIVAGDFNMVSDGHIFRRTWATLTDAFSVAGWGTGGTKLQGCWKARIDHILFGKQWKAAKARVGPDVGSDHLPLIAEISRASADGSQQ